MVRGGRFCRLASNSAGRMGQTSYERLKNYLAQLPPQSQALLMRDPDRVVRVPMPSAAIDVDTPEDLLALETVERPQ